MKKTPTDGLLLEANRLITGDRNETYGHILDDYGRVRDVFESLTGIDMSPSECIIFMVCLKMSRLMSNLEKQVWHRDSAVDAAGFLGCLEVAIEELIKQEKPIW